MNSTYACALLANSRLPCVGEKDCEVLSLINEPCPGQTEGDKEKQKSLLTRDQTVGVAVAAGLFIIILIIAIAILICKKKKSGEGNISSIDMKDFSNAADTKSAYETLDTTRRRNPIYEGLSPRTKKTADPYVPKPGPRSIDHRTEVNEDQTYDNTENEIHAEAHVDGYQTYDNPTYDTEHETHAEAHVNGYPTYDNPTCDTHSPARAPAYKRTRSKPQDEL
ncbi:predicted protein [Nematostella vectensis]|uniref:Uncharacterized protein n=1 Tax=Nematostella vectensis TaxID=45351 RepID=A7SIT6_NEMVE|nr:predicted protein [Nematostella vectensis]|eukprot:XP_001628475.1 predicted protein [Nematostella vectensis]